MFTENRLMASIIQSEIYQIVFDSFKVDGKLTEKHLFEFTLFATDIAETLKLPLENIERAKVLRLVSKKLRNAINIKNIYALEREILKIQLLDEFVSAISGSETVYKNQIDSKEQRFKYIVFIQNYVNLLILNKLNKHYQNAYQNKYITNLVTSSHPIAQKLNNVLFCLSTMAIERDENDEKLSEKQCKVLIKELNDYHTAFTKLSLFLFADHPINQKGLLPINLDITETENDTRTKIRNIFKEQTDIFHDSNPIEIKIKLNGKGMVDEDTITFRECLFKNPIIENIANFEIQKLKFAS
ncbi:hypothetical protein IPH67_04895 [bacterium]|nr:MAG: hypothetical protein IPH67_04895 [bacterium]